MHDVNIGIIGCNGRMGREIVQQVNIANNCTLSGALEFAGSKSIDESVAKFCPQFDIKITDDGDYVFSGADVLIDFTLPAAIENNINLAIKHNKPIVIGTTGLKSKHMQMISDAGKNIPVLYSRNMSFGLNAILLTVNKLAKMLKNKYDVDILDLHHRNKIDSPSGTALAIGEQVAKGMGIANTDYVIDSSDKHKYDFATKIGFSVIRSGDIIGEHNLIFANDYERITLSHSISNRSVFAKGAVQCAMWLYDKEPGLYSMHDVIDMENFDG